MLLKLLILLLLILMPLSLNWSFLRVILDSCHLRLKFLLVLHDLVVDELCSIPVDDIMPLSRLVSYFDFDCIIYLYHNKGSVILRIREIHIPFSASGVLLRTPTAVSKCTVKF
ncbi:WD repeat-containing protein 55 homolog [Striga asiatica]|uniref:WD repeat-containing protein 55 homolog n=1 Tax=Striga asiatica TaxID=4170 RepID=A0A5A7R8Q0_STRAF|nr:WD repeat-containing protein 55 homolog [Striga asiatica]